MLFFFSFLVILLVESNIWIGIGEKYHSDESLVVYISPGSIDLYGLLIVFSATKSFAYINAYKVEPRARYNHHRDGSIETNYGRELARTQNFGRSCYKSVRVRKY